eukprot:TRINITY_DN26408_c0_g2_i1.p1 TRINITY_DN26408_c0_g2~~TRINITY_DN26408_c0_g2_i1.p1  ORF type:complete len:286 (+),score=38.71 TRINITY_DN26408_c0_g2_i1:126-983(+)
MVELGVPTCVFGKPPDPLTAPPYPGISPNAFDPSGAVAAYRDVLTKERTSRAVGQLLTKDIIARRGQPPSLGALCGDVMPGRESLRTLYNQLGYTFSATTGLPAPPKALSEAQGSLPPLRRRAKTEVAASGPAGTSQPQKSFVKPEAHSRLSLLEGWHEQLKAGNTLQGSASAPNVAALFGGASSRSGSRCAGGEGDEGLSCLSSACPASQLSVADSRLSASRASLARRSAVSARPPPPWGTDLRNWTYDTRKGPTLTAPGVQPTLTLGNMTIAGRMPSVDFKKA